jgi:hypothetical protein
VKAVDEFEEERGRDGDDEQQLPRRSELPDRVPKNGIHASRCLIATGSEAEISSARSFARAYRAHPSDLSPQD